MKFLIEIADSLIYLFIGPFTVIGTIPFLLMEIDSTMSLPHFTSPAAITGGYVLMNLGAALALWCTWLMHRGGGSPIPSMPATQPVKSGPYGVVRHPMMYSLLIVGIGEVLVTGSLLMLVWVPIAMRAGALFVATYEEPVLLLRFGDAYKEYCQHVPRWMPTWIARRG